MYRDKAKPLMKRRATMLAIGCAAILAIASAVLFHRSAPSISVAVVEGGASADSYTDTFRTYCDPDVDVKCSNTANGYALSVSPREAMSFDAVHIDFNVDRVAVTARIDVERDFGPQPSRLSGWWRELTEEGSVVGSVVLHSIPTPAAGPLKIISLSFDLRRPNRDYTVVVKGDIPVDLTLPRTFSAR